MWCIIYYNGFILILLTLIWAAMPSCDASKGSDIQNLLRANKINPGFYAGPYVDGHSVTNVTTQIGTHAFLPCKVKKLGNKSVSWIRVRDGHILTVDRTTFIADDRFQALHVEHTGLWTLQIKYVQGRDAGLYECQVSDLEPKISARVNLQVVVPRTEIIGDTDRYVKADSKVQLRCIVRGALEPPSYIIWSHGAEQIFPENRNGWQASIERETENDPPNTIGTLIINSAKEKDSGSYICSPSNSPPVTITLHVINAQPAEIIGDPETNISAANVSIKLKFNLFISYYYYLIIILFYFTTFKNYL